MGGGLPSGLLWPDRLLICLFVNDHVCLKDNHEQCLVLNRSFLTKPIIHSGHNADIPEVPRIFLQEC